MDNLCHSLVGWAMGEADLKRKTRYGNAALIISANLPDLDVLVFMTSTPSVEFRRGWTHGIVAQVVLPIVLTAVIAGFDRVRRLCRDHFVAPGLRRHSRVSAVPFDVPWLVVLCYAGVLSHVGLDFLNNYGVRLLAPFNWRWFYGDALFIADLWLWLALAAGIWLSRRRGSARPARGALVFATCYISAMLVSAQTARGVVASIWQTTRGTEPRALMVGPLPITPFTRTVVVDAGDHYETGTFSWWSASVSFDADRIPKNDRDPAVAVARESRLISAYLVWSRFPYWTITPANGAVEVGVRDMRFGGALGGRLATRVVIHPGDPATR
jgi:inner membrane protein